MTRIALVSAALVAVLTLTACNAKSGGNSANETVTAEIIRPLARPPGSQVTNAPLYPDWAQAVAPPYPNVSVGILINQGNYQLQSADDLATVGAWYKAHVSGATWTTDATDGAMNTTVGAVQISLSKNTLTANGADKIKTMIEINHR